MLKISKQFEDFLVEKIIEISYSSEEKPTLSHQGSKDEIFATNLELNECLNYVDCDVICGITIQIVKD